MEQSAIKTAKRTAQDATSATSATGKRGLAPKIFLTLAALISAIGIYRVADEWWTSYAWTTKLNKMLKSEGVANLSDLVGFKYECVYFLHAYDFTLPMQKQISAEYAPFVKTTWGDPNYLYVVYSRPKKRPFLMRLHTDRFVFSHQRSVRICGAGAQLVISERPGECPNSKTNRICITPTNAPAKQRSERN